MDFRVKVQADLDAKNFESQLNALKQKRAKIPVELDIKNSDFDRFVSNINKLAKKINLNVDASGVGKSNQQVEKLSQSVRQLSNFKFKIDTSGTLADVKSLGSQIEKFKNQISDKGNTNQSSQLNSIKKSYQELLQLQQSLSKKSANGTLTNDDLDEYNRVFKTATNQVKILKSELSEVAGTTNRIKLTSNIETWLKNNTKATKDAKQQLKSYVDEMNSLGDSLSQGRFNEIQNAFKQTTSQMQASGNVGKSMFAEAKRALGDISTFVGVYGAIQQGVDTVKQMASAVHEVDDAMTELKMATGVSDTQAQSLMKTYASLGNELKATMTDVSASSTEWLKQGKSIQESQALTKDSIVLSKIGDLSSEDATKTITAYMKSYNATEEQVMDFVDQISAIDMASATDVGGLSDAFNEVAANAKQAGVETNKLLSYAAVIGETSQEGMSSVGTSLNAIFSRMGNIKLSRLKDYETGEDLSNVETVLRGVGISLRDSQDDFRDFDDVLDETASRWGSFSEVQQRAVSQAFAGTHHMNDFMILMQNYSKAQEYMQIANESSGQSMEKFSAYQDSMTGKIEGFKNAFQSLSTAVLDSSLLKGLIDGGTTLLNILTKILDVGNGIPALLTGIAGTAFFKNLDLFIFKLV